MHIRRWRCGISYGVVMLCLILAGDMHDALIRLRRIYNFLCSMHDYISVPHIFTMFLYHFGMIYGTNLLTRYPVPVLFSAVFLF